MTTKKYKFAVDYSVFGDPRMRRGDFEVYSLSQTEETLARHIEGLCGYEREYVKVAQFILLEEPRASYNQRL